mgnify:CR=1 FL=1
MMSDEIGFKFFFHFILILILEKKSNIEAKNEEKKTKKQ